MKLNRVCAAVAAAVVSSGAAAYGAATVMLSSHAAGSVVDTGKNGPDTLSTNAFTGQSSVDEARGLLEYNLGFIAGHTITSARIHGQINDAQNTVSACGRSTSARTWATARSPSPTGA
jgi:hypothetical protein